MPLGAARVGRLGEAIEVPETVDGLAHWYDATELLGFDDGDSVGTWPDEEGTDNLTQATGSQQPVYKTGIIGDKPVVRFDGLDDLMNVDWPDVSEPYQFFIVFQLRAVAGGGSTKDIFDGFSLDEHRFADNAGNGWLLRQGSNVFGSQSDTDQHIGTVTYRSGSNNDELRLEGVQDLSGDSGNSSSGGFTLGARAGNANHISVDVGEVLFYDTEIATADRDGVESYLSDKWGISI